jgi:hypothetical protein
MTSIEENRVARIKAMHRRLGMVVAVFLLLLAGTGVLLNHTEDLGLAEYPLSGFPGTWLYDMEADSSIDGWQVGENWFYASNSTLYLNGDKVDYCEGSLVGAVEISSQLLAQCSMTLFVLDSNGQLIEKLSAGSEIPQGISAISMSDQGLIMRTEDGLLSFDINSLETTPFTAGSESISFTSPQILPQQLLDLVPVDLPEFNMERLILDIHSGRILGSWRQIIMDLLAVLMFTLVLGGIVMLHLRKD